MVHFFWRTAQTFIQGAYVPEAEVETFKKKLLTDETVLVAYYVTVTNVGNGLKQRTHNQIKRNDSALRQLTRDTVNNPFCFA